jgi:hypothetical protein
MDERIFSTALSILEGLEARGLGSPEVVMGGGTVAR